MSEEGSTNKDVVKRLIAKDLSKIKKRQYLRLVLENGILQKKFLKKIIAYGMVSSQLILKIKILH